jgi:hypothetical protein
MDERDLELGSVTGTAMVADYGEFDAEGVERRSLWNLLRPPDLLYHPDPHLRLPRTAGLFDHAGPDTRVLNVGGGPRRYRPREIILNLAAFPNVDCIGDAHNIPFVDGTFDSIICNAVLEHVYDPHAVAAEMVRVLKPGGWLYAEAPFIFFFHGYPSDFHRFTREGMRRMFRNLSPLEIGITCGPVSAALQSTNILLQIFVPARPRALRKVFNGVFRWVTFSLRYLDVIVNRHPEAHLLAGGFYALGRKPAGRDGQGAG